MAGEVDNVNLGGEVEGQTVLDDQQIGESVLRAEPEYDDEVRRRMNVAYAIRYYARKRIEQRKKGHIPKAGDGWKYSR